MRLLSLLVFAWLIAGVVAVVQDGLLADVFNSEPSCTTFANLAVTVVAGGLNYTDFQPRVGDCELPQPDPQ
ncbi:hypothetical protein [Nocardia sp. BMG51109]|uniref:hypothetical protein n=1 Tax=Nocardia sp. BMG51109 TaxID=1056816 RepID=UPI0004B6169C|nr:hypothetical protein [Nocardia sp. BMG51109]